MTYAWIIDEDRIATLGTVSVVGVKGGSLPRMAQVDGTRFRLLDDDGEVYYVGRFFGDPDSQEAFGPLDDFGEPAAGCTTIQYHRNGQWETL